MARRAARVTLLLLLVAALAGAAALIAREERAAAAARAAATNVDVVSWRVLHDVSEARTGLQAYGVPGQEVASWRKKVGAALTSATDAVDDLRIRVNDAGALNDLDAAAAALDTLTEVDARASRLAGFESRPQAASLVFADGLEAAAVVARRVESARQAEQQAVDRSLLARRRVQAAAAGTAGLAALLVALLLAPRTSVPASASGAAAPTEASPENQERAAAPAVTMAPEPAAVAAAVDAEPLRAAAELCTDFARLVDSHELPALLERAAGLLDASGLIVWVADPPRQRLQPLLTHGYPASALARLPVIPREADNATAAAYRGGRVEVVFSNASSPGAIVVPILTGDGCVGVMAAEVRHGRETSETLPALARIVAAQLAAVVAIAPAQDERTGAERVANAE
jgi:hypothetical protein